MDVDLHVRMAQLGDLADIARLGAEAQADATQFCLYIGEDVQTIAAEIASVPDWEHHTAVAFRGPDIVGWLLIEGDSDLGRLWWWGPFVGTEPWDTVADALFEGLAHDRDCFGEWEACGGELNLRLSDWAQRHGMEAEASSALLATSTPPGQRHSISVRPIDPSDHARVAALHAGAFAGSHLAPEALLRSEDHTITVAVDQRDDVLGYLASERHADNTGYIDFVAVDASHRGRGIGAALVSDCTAALLDGGAPIVALTVSATNVAARGLYAKLGFTETCVAVPYRRGFSLRSTN